MYSIERTAEYVRIIDQRGDLLFDVKPSAIIVVNGAARQLSDISDLELIQALYDKGFLK